MRGQRQRKSEKDRKRGERVQREGRREENKREVVSNNYGDVWLACGSRASWLLTLLVEDSMDPAQ